MGCQRCGDWLDLAGDMEDLRFRGMECLACRLAPPDFEQAVSFGTYEDGLREMIHLLKYERMRGLARVLGERLAEAVLTLEGKAADDLLVLAVPLHATAKHKRGYNQAQLLAAEAVRSVRRLRPDWQLELADDVLQRRKSTEHQFALSRRQRRRNLAGAFVVTAGRRALGREVLLIDDVLTTGATARECAKVLRRAGAAKVWVATVARACGAAPEQLGVAEAVASWDLLQVGTEGSSHVA